VLTGAAAVVWRHRSRMADALLVRGIESKGNHRRHSHTGYALTSCAYRTAPRSRIRGSTPAWSKGVG
jgi:hypothetical protein